MMPTIRIATVPGQSKMKLYDFMVYDESGNPIQGVQKVVITCEVGCFPKAEIHFLGPNIDVEVDSENVTVETS